MWWVVADTQPERLQAVESSSNKTQAEQAAQAFEQGEEKFPCIKFYVVEADSRDEAIRKVGVVVQVQENDQWLAHRRAAQHKAG